MNEILCNFITIYITNEERMKKQKNRTTPIIDYDLTIIDVLHERY